MTVEHAGAGAVAERATKAENVRPRRRQRFDVVDPKAAGETGETVALMNLGDEAGQFGAGEYLRQRARLRALLGRVEHDALDARHPQGGPCQCQRLLEAAQPIGQQQRDHRNRWRLPVEPRIEVEKALARRLAGRVHAELHDIDAGRRRTSDGVGNEVRLEWQIPDRGRDRRSRLAELLQSRHDPALVGGRHSAESPV